MLEILTLGIMFGWQAPVVLEGEPEITEYVVYMENKTLGETNTVSVAAPTTQTEELELADGQYEVWVTAVAGWVYTNSVSGPQTNTVESDRSEQLTFEMPIKSPNKPDSLWAKIKKWLFGG